MVYENTNNDKHPLDQQPTLSDVLAIQHNLESLCEENTSLRTSARFAAAYTNDDRECIALSYFPESEPTSEGLMIGHISLSDRNNTTGRYDAYMNYFIYQDGDETTTHIVKRPPFKIFSNVERRMFTDMEASVDEINQLHKKILGNAALYNDAIEEVFSEVTKAEIQSLNEKISDTFLRQ